MAASRRKTAAPPPAAPSQEAPAHPARVPSDEMPERSRIFTFYSYKGGTGRSMSLANVAWILASNRQRVLVIDWDLEAPGLHRYFRPFLPDPDLMQSEGLIDFFSDFSEAARLQHRAAQASAAARKNKHWYEDHADLLRYAVSLEHEFPKPGTIDFVPAGRQGASYGIRVNGFDWTKFYQELGGGVFLESVKKRLLADYDYILIDSRTGLSDTSGICTVQMPGELVVFFTLNRQSIIGAAAAAQSAIEQRRVASGESTLRVWPVATRVDENEKERLETARTLARETFAPFLQRTVKRKQRQSYWARAEVPYVPFYAYEEILATVADRPQLRSSLLASMESLTDALTEGRCKSLAKLPERTRLELRSRFGGADNAGPRTQARFYLSYGTGDLPPKTIQAIAAALEGEFGADNVAWDGKIPLGARFQPWLDQALADADHVLFFVGRQWLVSAGTARELQLAAAAGKTLVAIIVAGDVLFSMLPQPLREVMGLRLSLPLKRSDLASMVNKLRPFGKLTGPPEVTYAADPDDPQRGLWGGRSSRNGRKLSATVRAVSKHWFKIELEVAGTGRKPLEGHVNFHLHSSFEPDMETVAVEAGTARLTLHAYGAFTVGSEADGGNTQLELDLAKLPKAPVYFREH